MIDKQDNLRTAQEQTVDYQPGTVVFNKFKIIEKIGAGGMARVYKAEHIDLNRNVALKVLYSSIMTPRAIMRFQNEAKTSSKLVHQNIASILDFGVSKEGEPYMAMELIEGMTLQRWISLEGKLDFDDFFSVFIQVANALAHAHEKGVIHRDITPGNIMIVTGLDELPIVKVLDFGVAKLVSQEEPLGFETDPGTILGSPLYISPEQSRSDSVTPQTDLYSLGCVMYECLVGHTPFDAAMAFEVFVKHREEPVPPITGLEDTPVTESLIVMLMKHLEKDPANRPRSAGDTSEQLIKLRNQHLAQSAKVDGDKELSSEPKRTPPRKESVRSAVTICGAALIVCAALATLGYTRGWFTPVKAPANTKILSNLPFHDDYQQKNVDEIEQVLQTTNGTDASLKKFAKTSDELFTLPLANSKVTDEGLKYLTTQKSLRTLDLSNSKVRSLKYVKDISNLENLNLMGCTLEPGALKNLQNLKNLKLLLLDSTNVTTQDVVLLAKNQSIGRISLTSCPNIGPKELDFLQREMPLCTIPPKAHPLIEEIALYIGNRDFEKGYSLSKAIVASLEKNNSPHLMTGLMKYSTLCRYLGKFEESRLCVEKQKALAKRTGTIVDWLAASDSEIHHWAHAGELDKLIKAVDENIACRRKIGVDANEIYAVYLDEIATVCESKKLYKKAIEYEKQAYLLWYKAVPSPNCTQAEAQAMERYGPKGIMTLVAKTRLGKMFYSMNDYQSAKKHLRFLLNPIDLKANDNGEAAVIAHGLLLMATICLRDGSPDEARLYCTSGIALCNKFPKMDSLKKELDNIMNTLQSIPQPPRFNSGATT